MTSPLVRCERVTRTFGRGATAVVAVHDIDCELRTRDAIGLIGPSGSGKSTLVHLIAGLDAPTMGAVVWADCRQTAARAERVGVVFQSPSLIPDLDVLDNVTLPLLLAGVDRTTARLAAHEALARIGLSSLEGRVPDELSGGQAQRVAVARSLAVRPRIILADEPTGQLDLETGTHVIDALLEAVDDLGAALVVSTHDRAIAERLPETWTMHDGRLSVEGATRW